MTELAIADIPRSLLRRKGLILCSGLVAAGLAVAVVKVLPVSYAGEGNLAVDSRNANGEADTASRVDLLQSAALIRRVVDQLHLGAASGLVPSWRLPPSLARPLQAVRDQALALTHDADHADAVPDAGEMTVRQVKKHLKVSSKEHSNVVTLEYQAGSPEVAAAVVNALMAQCLAVEAAARDGQLAQLNGLLTQQARTVGGDLAAAEQRLARFVAEHDLPEVQGSSAAAVQLNRDTEQLAQARQELARRQAALEFGQHGAGESTEEALASRTISNLKAAEAQASLRVAELSSADPRRAAMQTSLTALRVQIDREAALVTSSISHGVQVARAQVQALQAAIRYDTDALRIAAVGTATLAQLRSDVADKRSLYATLLTGTQQMRLAAAQSSSHVLFEATPPEKPVQALTTLALMLGFIGGTVAASSAVVLRTMLSPRIHSTAAMAAATGLPVFGSLPSVRRRGKNILAAPRTASLVAETLRAMCLALRAPVGGTAVLVTSSEVGEGKTTVAFALARRIAEDGLRVLLIDADLRRPRLRTLLGIEPAHALEAVLDGSASVAEATHAGPAGMHFLLAAGGTANPIRSLSSEPLHRLLDDSRGSYDVIVLDSPPVLHVADAIVLAKRCDHVLFVVQSGRVPAAQVGEAARRFPNAERAKIVTLLNRVPSLDKRDTYSGYAA